MNEELLKVCKTFIRGSIPTSASTVFRYFKENKGVVLCGKLCSLAKSGRTLRWRWGWIRIGSLDAFQAAIGPLGLLLTAMETAPSARACQRRPQFR
jgi:hypothetical protein